MRYFCTILLSLQLLTLCGISGNCFPTEVPRTVGGNLFCGNRCIVGPTIDIGMAWRFAVFGSTTMTDTAIGSSVIGDAGVYPAVTVPVSTRITGQIHLADATAFAVKAQIWLSVSRIIVRQGCVTSYGPSVELGGRVLTQGIYDSTVMTSEYNVLWINRGCNHTRHNRA